MCRLWRPFPTIKHHLFTVTGTVQQPEPAATYARAVGLDDRQRCTHCHGCIKGIPAGIQHLHTRPRRKRVRRGNRLAGRLRLHRSFCGLYNDRQQQRNQRITTAFDQGICNTHKKGSKKEPAGVRDQCCRHQAVSPVRRRYLSINSSRVSSTSGLNGMQSTGHTSTHCEVS